MPGRTLPKAERLAKTGVRNECPPSRQADIDQRDQRELLERRGATSLAHFGGNKQAADEDAG